MKLPTAAIEDMQRFHNRLRVLLNIDMHEMVKAGIFASGDTVAYRAFADNPYRWFIRASDEDQERFWPVFKKREGIVKRIDAHGDAGEGERLYGLKAGHVLTEQDAIDLDNAMADHNDEIGKAADAFHEARLETLREIGGEELVRAAEAADAAFMRKCTENALARFRAAEAKHKAETPENTF